MEKILIATLIILSLLLIVHFYYSEENLGNSNNNNNKIIERLKYQTEILSSYSMYIKNEKEINQILQNNDINQILTQEFNQEEPN